MIYAWLTVYKSQHGHHIGLEDNLINDVRPATHVTTANRTEKTKHWKTKHGDNKLYCIVYNTVSPFLCNAWTFHLLYTAFPLLCTPGPIFCSLSIDHLLLFSVSIDWLISCSTSTLATSWVTSKASLVWSGSGCRLFSRHTLYTSSRKEKTTAPILKGKCFYCLLWIMYPWWHCG